MTQRSGGLVDVSGLRVGHRTANGDGYLSGTTVVLAPAGGMVAGVDVRGGAPGSRETDLLSPTAAVDRVHALVLTGGSAFGLSAASGVADALAERGVGFRIGEDPMFVVPIVPAAVLLDLGRGGEFRLRPDEQFGRDAVADAMTATADQMLAEGLVGAGTGACTGRLKGGLGQASATLPGGATVAALVVANASGPAYDQRTGELWAARLMTDADGPRPGVPTPAERDRLAEVAGEIRATLVQHARLQPEAQAISSTTLGVVATDLTLTKAQCSKLAAIAHDGLARAVNPVHTMGDGDLFFGAATGDRGAPDLVEFHDLLTVAADVVTRAIGRAILSATTVTTSAGSWPSYADLAPSSLPA